MVEESQLALWLQLFSPLPQFHYCYFWYTMMSMRENQNQYQFPPIQTDATSSLSCAIQFNTPQDQGSTHEECRLCPLQQQQEPHDHLSTMGGSSSHHAVDQSNEQCSDKWMSSKMRLMRKMLGSDQILVKKQRRTQSAHDQMQTNQASSSSNINNNPNNDIIRVCSNCKTTKTPLWRGGPQGPKSLCNACGIRQMKARRAMRAAAGLTNCKMQKEDVDRTVPFKKRFKINVTSASAQKKLRFDEITISLSNKSAFQQTIPQEERDAAILLMALSCGLIHG